MTQRQSSQKFASLSCCCITLVIIFCYLSPLPALNTFFVRIDYLLYDMRFNWVPLPIEPSLNQIVIVDVDEKSLEAEGRWPWSRRKIAQLTNRLVESGAVIIGFDMIFSEPEDNLIDALVAADSNRVISARGQLLDLGKALKEYRKDFDYDQQFAESIAKAEVVLGYFFHSEESVSSGLMPSAIPFEKRSSAWDSSVYKMKSYTANLPVFSESALSQGFFTLIPDLDGKIRRAPLVLEYEQKFYASLALEMARELLFVERVEMDFAPVGNANVIEQINLERIRIPVDAFGQALIPYNKRLGKQRGYFKYLSATDILNGKFELNSLDSAIVFVGTSASGLEDIKTTPLATALPGVEVHAVILDSLLKYQQYGNQFPFRPVFEQGITPSALLLLGLLLAWLLPRLSPLKLFSVCSALFIILIASNFYIWWAFRFDLPLAPFLSLAAILTLFSFAEGYFRETDRRESMTAMFGQYVPKAHIEKMLSEPGAFSFEGESKELTVMFCDIRNFTTISEGLSAAELKGMLNKFFTPITQIIFENNGTIDKYVGDMVMAFWGAPIEDSQHANHAVRAALAMLEKVEQLKPEFKAMGLPEINIGIGLNTGPMNVGDMGSSYRRAYTVLGDAVNLGSRLEGVTKYYGVKLLIGEKTTQLADQFISRAVDRIKVKGKTSAITAYEPLAEIGALNGKELVDFQRYNKAISAYYQKNWVRATLLLRLLVFADDSHRALYQEYLKRIEQLKEVTLPESWDGVYEHLTK